MRRSSVVIILVSIATAFFASSKEPEPEPVTNVSYEKMALFEEAVRRSGL